MSAKWTKVMKQVIEMYEQGKQAEEIAKLLGITVVFVRGVIRMKAMF